jgi:hypothetical protein
MVQIELLLKFSGRKTGVHTREIQRADRFSASVQLIVAHHGDHLAGPVLQQTIRKSRSTRPHKTDKTVDIEMKLNERRFEFQSLGYVFGARHRRLLNE